MFFLGSRIKETHDFGFITLDIMSVIPEDAGMYMCKAINKAGDAVTTTSLRVHGEWAVAIPARKRQLGDI